MPNEELFSYIMVISSHILMR